MRIKPWYVQIQQNWAIFLQVHVTHFEYWLLAQAGKYFVYEREEIIFFFPVKRENNGKTIFIWTAPKFFIICFRLSLYNCKEKLWSFMAKKMFIKIRLCILMTYVFKSNVIFIKIYMVKFNVSTLNRLKIMSFL